MYKKTLGCLVFLLISLGANAQIFVRYDNLASVTTQVQAVGIFTTVLAPSPFAQVTVCAHPANGVPCTNTVTTYTDITGTTSCPANSQLTPYNGNVCQGTADAKGNFGFWIGNGTYDYTICPQGQFSCLGPYPITVSPNLPAPTLTVPVTLTAGPTITTQNIFSLLENTTGTFSGDAIFANMLTTGLGGFSGNFMDMQINGTSKWKLTNSGTTQQTGTVYSKQLDTTLIADMFCNTAFTLDDSCISNAIAALPSYGGIINLSAGTYNISNTITINKSVTLRGAGTSTNCTQSGCTAVSPPYTPATELAWVGNPSSTVISITPATGNVAIGRVNLKDISIDVGSIASMTGIDANCIQYSEWNSVSIDHAAVGMVLECRTGSNSMLNTFVQTEMNMVGVGLVLDGPYSASCSTTCGDAFNNTFIRTHLVFNGANGLDIKSADNNQFMDLTIYRQAGVGNGINFEAPSGSGTTARLGGTYTSIYHYQPPTTNGVVFSAGGNVIQDYDIANGQATPTWTGSHNAVYVTSGTSTYLITDATGGFTLYDATSGDSTPGKKFTVSSGHLQFLANNGTSVLFDMDDFGTTKLGNGSNTVYRCTVAGALPIGALTIATGNCGTAVTTGISVQ